MQATLRDLKPMGYGGILDRTFELYRQNFVLFAGIVGVLQIPLAFLQVAAMPSLFGALAVFFKAMQVPETMPTAPAPSSPGLFFVYMVVAYLAAAFIPVLMTKAVSERYLGQPATIGGSYSYLLRRFFSYLWTCLVVGFMVFGLYIAGAITVGLIVGILAAVTRSGIASVIAAILMITVLLVFLVWFIIRSIIVGPVFVVESTWGFSSLRRSWELTKGQAGRMFVLFVITYLLLIAIVMGVSALAILGINAAMAVSEAAQYLGALIQGVLNSLTTPIPWILLTLLYYDIRIRKEAFDLQVLAQSLGSAADWGVSAATETAGSCGSCGAALPVGAQFCGNCGTSVTTALTFEADPGLPPEPGGSESGSPPPPPPSGSGGAEREPPKYRRA